MLSMFRFIALRIVQSLFLILGVLILIFFMVRLTGDPVGLMVSREATTEQREAFKEVMGLNRPLMVQFADYLGSTLRGDLGRSLRLKRPNIEIIMQRLPATVELAVAALALMVMVALPLGIVAGLNSGKGIDALVRMLGLAGQVIPSFWLAMLLIIFFAVGLRWLPSFGRDGLKSLILPAIALGFGGIGQLVRLSRSAVLEVKSSDFIRTARAKGLGQTLVAARHILPNIAIPLLSVLGIQFIYLLGGSVYIETIFAWPGLGNLLNDAVRDNDFPLVQAITLFISLFAIGVNLLTDLMYGWLDPRIRQA